jgi:hypothetical protein
MPTATDLVTDLPADFETFGQAVATSMADLLGGTTGQVLSKASNTNMDFTWVTSDDANAIQNAIVDAKGDLIAASAADTPARLAVGTNGQYLKADSTAGTGLAWATLPYKILQVVNALTNTQTSSSSSTYADTALTATITPSSATSKVLIFVNQAGCGKGAGTASTQLALKLQRNGADLITFEYGAGYNNTSSLNYIGTCATTYLDSPGTTSATTYKTVLSNPANAASVVVQVNNAVSTITLMEVQA